MSRDVVMLDFHKKIQEMLFFIVLSLGVKVKEFSLI